MMTCARSENYYVSDHKCVQCGAGTYNSSGDDASGPDTVCDVIECAENEYVSNHTCQACPAGTYNAPGDPLDGGDTVCDSVLCNDNYYVEDHKCLECPPGTYNSIGDDASGPDTICDTIVVVKKMNMFQIIFVKHVQQALIMIGDLASGPDTVCDSILCENYSVIDHECVQCSPVHIILLEMMPVDLIQRVIRYNVRKMNMFQIISVKHVQQALTMLPGIWQVMMIRLR